MVGFKGFLLATKVLSKNKVPWISRIYRFDKLKNNYLPITTI